MGKLLFAVVLACLVVSPADAQFLATPGISGAFDSEEKSKFGEYCYEGYKSCSRDFCCWMQSVCEPPEQERRDAGRLADMLWKVAKANNEHNERDPEDASGCGFPKLLKLPEKPADRLKDVEFDPTSPLVAYKDVGTCGPRGDDAAADTEGCKAGAHVVKHVPNTNYRVVETASDCHYYEYTVFECNPVPAVPVFDPASPLVSYRDLGTCGPRGEDARADLRSCLAGAHVVKQVVAQGDDDEVVATIEGCHYFEFMVYECDQLKQDSLFQPGSPMVSYRDIGTCGPRGEDARADLSSCVHGAEVVEEVRNNHQKVKAVINGCSYFEYTVYQCKGREGAPFDPASTLVRYVDEEKCGPRGDDAQEDIPNSCYAGAHVVKTVPLDNWKTVAEIDGCKYFAYTVFECNAVPVFEPFDPASPMVSYKEIGSCGPRGDDAKADLRTCRAGAHVVRHVPNRGGKVVATIDGCRYYTYTIYQCNPVKDEAPFDPKSPLVSYTDLGACGPRGANAMANTEQCSGHAHVLKHVPMTGHQVIATINGCDYLSYTVYTCEADCPVGYFDCGDHCNYEASCDPDAQCFNPTDPRGCAFAKSRNRFGFLPSLPSLPSLHSLPWSDSEPSSSDSEPTPDSESGTSWFSILLVMLVVLILFRFLVVHMKKRQELQANASFMASRGDYWLG